MSKLNGITSELILDTLTNDLTRKSITKHVVTFVIRFRRLSKGVKRSQRELNELVFCKLIAPWLSVTNLGETSVRQAQRDLDSARRSDRDDYAKIAAYIQTEERKRHEDEAIYRRLLALQLPTGEPMLSKQMSSIGLCYPQGVTEETPSAKPVKKTPAKDAKVIKRDGVYAIVHHTCVFLPHCELCSKPD